MTTPSLPPTSTPAASDDAVLSAQIDIAAPVGKVWRLLAQQDLMSRWSPETWKQWFFPRREIRRGTISINLNKRGPVVWPTISRYTEVRAHERLRFFVVGPNAWWGYDLTEIPSGTRVTLRRDVFRGRPSLATRIVGTLLLGGVTSHEGEIEQGMHVTLARVKAELEA